MDLLRIGNRVAKLGENLCRVQCIEALQRVCPAQRVADGTQRRANVGNAADHRGAAIEEARLGEPHCQRVVRFGRCGDQLNAAVATVDHHAAVERLVRHRVAVCRCRTHGLVELAAVQPRLQLRGLRIAPVARRHAGQGDQRGPDLAAFRRVFLPQPGTRVVAAVAMAVDNGQDRRRGQLAQARDHGTRHATAWAGVDDHHAARRLDGQGIALSAKRMDTRDQVRKVLAAH